jgi:predicted nucleotidyltransferase
MAVYTAEEIKKIIVPILKRHNAKKIVLFGSYAREGATGRSDVDIYVDSGGALSGLNFYSAYAEVENRLGKSVDMLEALDVDKDSAIYSEISANGVVLYEE